MLMMRDVEMKEHERCRAKKYYQSNLQRLHHAVGAHAHY